MSAEVSICIPTWQSAAFIARTLGCARAQTHRDIRILVSVDLCEDDTAAICQAAAREDTRIRVTVQTERLGWSRNCNALLDQVETPFFFFYFHDDVIEPAYVERLLAALRERPDAAAAQCDLQRFGTRDEFIGGAAYEGSAARRLLQYLVGPRGAPLRALTRSTVVHGGLRFEAFAGDAAHAAHLYSLALVAAGPCLHVPETLYLRWYREGMMTAEWPSLPIEQISAAHQEMARLCATLIDAAEGTAAEREAVRVALALLAMADLRRRETASGAAELIPPAALGLTLPPVLALPEALDAEARRWLMVAQADLLCIEVRHAIQAEDWGTALFKARLAAMLDPDRAVAQHLLARCLEQAGQHRLAYVAAERARLTDPSLPGLAALVRRCRERLAPRPRREGAVQPAK